MGLVNAVPVGLGSVGSPTAWYPETNEEIPLNPQALNRYTYVLNNPLKYVDPEGLWTFQLGLSLSAGWALGGSVSLGLVFSPLGVQGYITPAPAAPAFPQAGVSLQGIYTNAPDTQALTGNPSLTTVIGGTGPSFIGGGVIGTAGAGYGGGGLEIGIGTPGPTFKTSVGPTFVTPAFPPPQIVPTGPDIIPTISGLIQQIF